MVAKKKSSLKKREKLSINQIAAFADFNLGFVKLSLMQRGTFMPHVLLLDHDTQEMAQVALLMTSENHEQFWDALAHEIIRYRASGVMIMGDTRVDKGAEPDEASVTYVGRYGAYQVVQPYVRVGKRQHKLFRWLPPKSTKQVALQGLDQAFAKHGLIAPWEAEKIKSDKVFPQQGGAA